MSLVAWDLYSGTGSATYGFEDQGFIVRRIDNDPQFREVPHTLIGDIFQPLPESWPHPDFIWASPPCQTFSVAGRFRHFTLDERGFAVPKDADGHLGVRLAARALEIVREVKPTFYAIENPRGLMRKLEIFKDERLTPIWQCQYGNPNAKPTDLFGQLPPSFHPRVCYPKAPDHAAAPRGSMGGTASKKGAVLRGMIPYSLSSELAEATIRDDRS